VPWGRQRHEGGVQEQAGGGQEEVVSEVLVVPALPVH